MDCHDISHSLVARGHQLLTRNLSGKKTTNSPATQLSVGEKIRHTKSGSKPQVNFADVLWSVESIDAFHLLTPRAQDRLKPEPTHGPEGPRRLCPSP